MRLSTYEIILPLVGTDEKPIEGYMLLTNGLYGAVDVVPKEDADKLQAGDFAGLPAALRERLMLRGHDCNFRCPYCFEQHRLKKGQDWLDNTMSDEMIETVFGALKDYRARGYMVNGCSFYGGEPFLAKNLGVVKKIADKCREMDLSMGAITNGYDLETYLDFIEEYKLRSLQVTVDGTAELNDRRRLHKDGREGKSAGERGQRESARDEGTDR